MTLFALHSFDAPSSSQGPYAIPFPFLSTAHIRALVNGTAAGVAFTVSGTNLTFTTPTISSGDDLIIYRETARNAAMVDFQDGGVLRAADVDTGVTQSLYILQEILDAGAGTTGSGLPSSAAGGLHWDAQGLQIRDLGTGTANDQAVNKGQMDTAIATAVIGGGLPYTGTVWSAQVSGADKKLTGLADPSSSGGVDLQVAATKAFVLAHTGSALPAPDGGGADNNSSLVVSGSTWAKTIPAAARVAMGLGTLSTLNQGVALGNVPALISASGTPTFPAVDGRNLLNVPAGMRPTAYIRVQASSAYPSNAGGSYTDWYKSGTGPSPGLPLNGTFYRITLAALDPLEVFNNALPTFSVNTVAKTFTIHQDGTYLLASPHGHFGGIESAIARSDGGSTALLNSYSGYPGVEHRIVVVVSGAPLTYALYTMITTPGVFYTFSQKLTPFIIIEKVA